MRKKNYLLRILCKNMTIRIQFNHKKSPKKLFAPASNGRNPDTGAANLHEGPKPRCFFFSVEFAEINLSELHQSIICLTFAAADFTAKLKVVSFCLFLPKFVNPDCGIPPPKRKHHDPQPWAPFRVDMETPHQPQADSQRAPGGVVQGNFKDSVWEDWGTLGND